MWPSQSFLVPGVGCRFLGMNPARRAVLTANLAIIWFGSGGPRYLWRFGLDM
ncbi:MAG: hypothetical protein OXC26_02995 [Albidovulum sp.]|nr:hypothetical protein [Albidovulum sp.]